MGKVIYREIVGDIKTEAEFELFEDFQKFYSNFVCDLVLKPYVQNTERGQCSNEGDIVTQEASDEYPPNEHGYIPPKGCWGGIDEIFQWRAVDKDGDVYFYEDEPRAGTYIWNSVGEDLLFNDLEDLTIDWTKTLTKRPEGV